MYQHHLRRQMTTVSDLSDVNLYIYLFKPVLELIYSRVEELIFVKDEVLF